MEHKPPTRVGRILSLVLLLILALIELGLVMLILADAVSPLTILRGLLVLLNLGVMRIVLYALVGLNRASYTLDRNAMIIRWGNLERVIPMSQVQGIMRGMDLGQLIAFRGIRLPGYWLGRGMLQDVGSVQFYCSTPLERQLVVKTAVGAFAISPEDPDKFVDLFARQKAMGVQQVVEPKLGEPGVGISSLFSDRVALILLAAGGLCNLAVLIFLSARFHHLPATFVLPAGKIDNERASSYLMTLALLGTAAWVLDGLLGVAVYRRLQEKGAAYLLWGAAVALQILLLGALIGLGRV